jgi:hypothetical protein
VRALFECFTCLLLVRIRDPERARVENSTTGDLARETLWAAREVRPRPVELRQAYVGQGARSDLLKVFALLLPEVAWTIASS